MGKKSKTNGRRKPQYVPALATVKRSNGGAVKMELVFQPEDAPQMGDQWVYALIRNGRRRGRAR